MKRKLQIFISSTYADLVSERQAAVEAILRAGHIPAGMELFAAGDKSQLETIYRWIDESDVYMLILGGRYGSIDPDTGKSYTQLEYEYALATGKRFFAVVLIEASIDRKLTSRTRTANAGKCGVKGSLGGSPPTQTAACRGCVRRSHYLAGSGTPYLRGRDERRD